MAYTSKQLTMAWTAVHNGIAPDEATAAQLAELANTPTSNAQALGFVLNGGDDTTAVALLSYQFFTGKAPTKDGVDYLVNSTTNPNDLNDGYYAKFNIENRYLNFAANLGVYGEGAADFAAKYGAMSFEAFVASVYETIVGSTYAKVAGVDVAAAIAYLVGTKDNLLILTRDAGMVTDDMTPAQVDLALKAAMAGLVMSASVKSDIGVYAAAANNFMLDMVKGEAVYGSDLAQDYGPNSGKGSDGTGKPLTYAPPQDTLPGAPPVTPPSGPSARNFVLTDRDDGFTGQGLGDTFTATDTTLNAGDVLDGGLGRDILIVNVAHGLAYTLPTPSVSNIETLEINASGTLTVGLGNWAQVFEQVNTTSAGQTAIQAEHANLTADVSDLGAASVLVQDTDDVTLTVTGGSTGTVTVNNADGDVVVQRQNVAAGLSGDIIIRGGKSVDITQTAASTVGNVMTNSAVEVHGDPRTETVKVTAPATAGDVIANTVEIQDINGGSSLPGFITQVEVDGYSTLTILDNALQTLKVAHGGDVALYNGGSTTPVTELDLTVDGVTGDVADNGAFQTLNLTQGHDASAINLDMVGLKVLTIDASGDIVLTNLDTIALESITITGAGDVDLGDIVYQSIVGPELVLDASTATGAITAQIDAGDTTVTTGSGDDTITVNSDALSKPIDLGDGHDTLIIQPSIATYAPSLSDVTGVEVMEIVNDIGGVTLDLTSMTDLETLDVTAEGVIDLIAAADADVTIDNTDQDGQLLSVDGGHDITINATGGGQMNIGSRAAAPSTPFISGDVIVNRTNAGADAWDVDVKSQGASVEVNLTAANGAGVTQAGSDVTIESAGVTSVTFKGSAVFAGDSTHGAHDGDTLVINDGASDTVTTVEADGFLQAFLNGGAFSDITLSHGGDVTINGTTVFDSLTLNLNGMRAASYQIINVTELSVKTGAEESGAVGLFATGATTVNVDGLSHLTLSGAPSSLETLNVTGSGGLTVDLSGVTSFAELNGGTTTGAINLKYDPANAVVTTGSGDDVITLSGSVIAHDITLNDGDDAVHLASGTVSIGADIKGGDGTDTLFMEADDTANFGGSFAGVVTGFEQLTLTDALGGRTIDLSELDGGFQKLSTFGGNNATLKGLVDGAVLELTNVGVSYTLDPTLFTGPDDSQALQLSGHVSNYGAVTAAGLEALDLQLNDPDSDPNSPAELTWTGDDLTTVTVTGHGNLTLWAGSTAMTNVDFSGLDGDFTWVGGPLAGPATITGSATGFNGVNLVQADTDITYVGGAGLDSVFVGAGKHDIDLGGTATTDRVSIGAVNTHSATDFVTIRGLGAGDSLILTSLTSSGRGLVNLVGSTELSDYLAAGATLADGNGDQVSYFELDGDVYIMVDRSTDVTFHEGLDVVVKLAGVAGQLASPTLHAGTLDF